MAKKAPKRVATDEQGSDNASDPSMATKGAKRAATKEQLSNNTSGRTLMGKAAKKNAVDEQSNGKTHRKEPERNVKKEEKPSNGFTKSVKSSSSDKAGVDIRGVHIPQHVKDFFAHAKRLSSDNPCCAFEKLVAARLVGPFELLADGLTALDDNQLRLHYRYATDLPEMQTVIVTDAGRYCLWRDVPNSEHSWIIYVADDDRFPKIELVGNRMEHALIHLGDKVKTDVKEFLPKSMNATKLREEMKSVCALRNKKKLGKAPNAVGLWVEITNDVGYRPIGETPEKLKETLDLICETDNPSLRQRRMQRIMEIVTFVQLGNDECDFGMGLELGYWLFLANHETLDKLTHRILSTAYTLLKRDEYKTILDAQMAPGMRRRSEVDIRKANQ